MSSVRFSIIITFYNQHGFVRAALESALSQHKALREIIVVDDGSTDGTQELLDGYADSLRLVKFTNNRGAIAARNHGAGLANGEYLIFMDGDDLLMQFALDVYERIIEERHPKVIVAKRTWFQGMASPQETEHVPTKIEYVEYPYFLAKDRPCDGCATAFVVDREVFRDVGGWTPEIFHADTVDYLTKLGCSGRTVMICSPSTFFYRLHSDNTIHTCQPFLQMTRRMIEKERTGEYPGGREHQFERYSWLGSHVIYWTRRAVRVGLYKDARKLAVSGWPMACCKLLRTAASYVGRRSPVQTLELRKAL